MTIASKDYIRRIFLLEFGAPITDEAPGQWDEKWVERFNFWWRYRGRQKWPKAYVSKGAGGTRIEIRAWHAFCNWHSDYTRWWRREQKRVNRSHTV